MLVISRQVGERIVIECGSTRIEVIAVEVRDGKVRIGIEAPAECGIVRSELLESGKSVAEVRREMIARQQESEARRV